jgi:hypothetical protein
LPERTAGGDVLAPPVAAEEFLQAIRITRRVEL